MAERPMILLNPGPVVLSERVRRALTSPDLCHREPEFGELQAEVRAGLLGVYGLDGQEWAPVLIGGSGTSAVEAMLTSLIPGDGRVLVIENGVYGERMSRMADRAGVACEPIHFEWGEAIDLAAVEPALAKGDISHVAVVHHETTTGRLNDLGALAELCRRHGVELLVDAVSSFGAEAIDWSEPALSACAVSANKCLHGVPGLAFVITRRRALAAGCHPPRGVYLDLAEACRAQDTDSTAFTPVIPAFYALRESLAELDEQGGWRERGARYRRLAEQVRAGLAKRGVAPYLAPEVSSVVLRSYHLPEGTTYSDVHDTLKARGFVIYAGQGGLAKSLFRISTMGEIDEGDMDRLLAAFDELGEIK